MASEMVNPLSVRRLVPPADANRATVAPGQGM
jgi:hypothetical protein